jgi:hypothetical protein
LADHLGIDGFAVLGQSSGGPRLAGRTAHPGPALRWPSSPTWSTRPQAGRPASG